MKFFVHMYMCMCMAILWKHEFSLSWCFMEWILDLGLFLLGPSVAVNSSLKSSQLVIFELYVRILERFWLYSGC